jgi:hypothetical protein
MHVGQFHFLEFQKVKLNFKNLAISKKDFRKMKLTIMRPPEGT